MMPLQRICESGFIFSRHGTTFLYPLQVRLIEALHQANLSGTVSVPSDFLVEKLLERGYSKKAIDSEIGRCFYFGTLTRMGVERDDEVRITPFFNLLYPSYYFTDAWINAENIRGDDLVDLLTDCSLDLTVWRKRNAPIRIFSGRG